MTFRPTEVIFDVSCIGMPYLHLLTCEIKLKSCIETSSHSIKSYISSFFHYMEKSNANSLLDYIFLHSPEKRRSTVWNNISEVNVGRIFIFIQLFL